MPNKEAQTRLDRVARDVSRMLLHGARPTDTQGNVRPSTVLTGQQLRVDVPSGDVRFEFSLGGSPTRVTVDHAQATATEQFMSEAITTDRDRYLSLALDNQIPTWVFQQRQFSLASPPPIADSVAIGQLAVAQLPSSVLQEAFRSENNFVSLFTVDHADKSSPIAISKWQPALLLRFPLSPIKSSVGLPAGTQAYELLGTPQGERWFLDQLGLLPGADLTEEPPVVARISLSLERQNQGILERGPELTEWSIARTNLTQESRPGPALEFAAVLRSVAPRFPYIVLSGDPGHEQDALRLFGMASITNAGGYYFAAANGWDNATALTVAVLFTPVPNADQVESAWLPRAANAVAFDKTVIPNLVRFSGMDHIEVMPYTPPGTVSFGWIRNVPTEPATLEDKFGYGTLSIVDYLALDAFGQMLPMTGAVPIISPMKALPGDHVLEGRPVSVVEDAKRLGGKPTPMERTAAMRLRSMNSPAPQALAAAAPANTETHHYRGTLLLYDKKTETPYHLLADPNRKKVSIKPGFRDVFGNHFDAAQGPVFERRLFYTDSIISPAEWPGVHFAVYPGQTAGQPRLFVELAFTPGLDATAKQRLREVSNQLRGASGDVSLSLLADPLVTSVQPLDVVGIADQLEKWADGETIAIVPLANFPVDGAVDHLVRFEPKIRVQRKPDFLPGTAELPEGALGALIMDRITTATATVLLQKDAAQNVPPSPSDRERRDEFREIAKELQAVVGSALGVQVGFIRDHLNQHEMWLVPNGMFPVPPSGNDSALWSFATPCPLRHVLGNESFQTPDFGKTTATDPRWKKYGLPIGPSSLVDQDYDELGRAAFRLLESQTADVAALVSRTNVQPMRSLLASREELAQQLATFNDGSPGAAGFTIPLLASIGHGELDPAAINRIARDAFLADLRSFYSVSTIVQLPLQKPGDRRIQTFHGNIVAKTTNRANPMFSDVLLSGGDQKVTVLYHESDSGGGLGENEALSPLTLNISHLQLPLNGVAGRANPFNEGPWLQLANPVQLTWNGFRERIPVVVREFPSKPIINSAEATMPVLDPASPQRLDASNAPLLSKWGWRFSFSLVNGRKQEVVHVTVRYPRQQPTPFMLLRTAREEDWAPVSLLNTLAALKLFADNITSSAVSANRLAILDDLAKWLVNFLASGPTGGAAVQGASGPIGEVKDAFSVVFHAPQISKDSRQVMRGPIPVNWTTKSIPAANIDTATVEARAEVSGNNAFLTGTNPVRTYKLSLELTQNEEFLGSPANPLVVYRCAPVESAFDPRPLNLWGLLRFDMTGLTFTTALQSFFAGVFRDATIAALNVEIGISLAWTKGSLSAVTPFSILPSDVKPIGNDIVGFVTSKCTQLLEGRIAKPADVDSAAIRLRVKVAAPDKDAPGGARTLLEVPAIDFPLLN